MNEKYKVIALMSGTSLDGVDISYCEYEKRGKWSFRLYHGKTISYDERWKKILSEIHNSSATEISEVDVIYGAWLGNLVKEFCKRYRIKPDFISSHGHTVFHQPGRGFTRQLGSGAHLSAVAGYPVVCDFRSVDVALGGQGAPLVPIGDMYLFPEAAYCLNLGGIANISFTKNNKRLAYDICACNMVLNHYSSKMGLPFDKDGCIAAEGTINKTLLEKLNHLPYYSKNFPKSLGREDIEKEVFPLIEKYNFKTADTLATFCEHIAIQILKVTGIGKMKKKILVTGGGVHNTFLLKRIKDTSFHSVLTPEKNIVDYKEAIIFGFLGVLRMRGEINCLKTVTGARFDSCGGAVYNSISQLAN